MKCNKCGAENDESSKYCSECGVELLKELSCPGCGKLLKPGAEFCVECGKKIERISNVIQAPAKSDTGIENVDRSDGQFDISKKTFGLYLSEYSWWWVPILPVSILLFGYGSNTIAYIIAVLAIWLTYKYLAWKTWAVSSTIISAVPSNSLMWGRLLIAVLFSALAAFFVATGPDQYIFLSTEAPLENGYSPTLFYCIAGWFWFLILCPVFSWRAYKLLLRYKK